MSQQAQQTSRFWTNSDHSQKAWCEAIRHDPPWAFVDLCWNCNHNSL